MLALILAMIFCVAIGAGVVGWVMLEARREGRGEFWTPEGEELIAGARRTGEKVRTRSEQLGRTAAGRTRDLAARLPERASERREHRGGAPDDRAARRDPVTGPDVDAQERREGPGTQGPVAADRSGDGFRAAS